MSLLVGVRRVLFLHAHPDDETLATGALIAELVARDVEVHVVTATRGERGELIADVIAPPPNTPQFVVRREEELAQALVALGVHHHAYLGAPPARSVECAPRLYADSGMRWIADGVAGPAADVAANAFALADVSEAAADLVAYLRLLPPDVVVTYDESGGYGHPDHVRAHVVAGQACAEVGVPLLEILPGDLDGGDGTDGEWLDLSARLPTVQDALRQHATQVRVDGADVIHTDGRREPILTRIGLRPVS